MMKLAASNRHVSTKVAMCFRIADLAVLVHMIILALVMKSWGVIKALRGILE
jgi:hypothetical protein